jgi:SAM-dependent methyltransferase
MVVSDLPEVRCEQSIARAIDAVRPELESVCRWYTHRELLPDSEEWQRNLSRYQSKISAALAAARSARQSTSLDAPSTASSEDPIAQLWDRQWRDNLRLNCEYFLPDGAAAEYTWGRRAFLMRNAGGTLTRILSLAAVLDVVKPASVLEVGCGDGLNLIYLASMFPETRFTGIELTPGGVAVAQEFQRQAALPDAMSAMLGSRTFDPAAFRRITFEQGSACNLPYRDGTFDIVLTCVALEQMEAVRATALAEITRVSDGWTAMLEPFRDFNGEGMRRDYIEAWNYFAGSVDELHDFGMEPVYSTVDLPQKLNLHAGLVVSRRRPR